MYQQSHVDRDADITISCAAVGERSVVTLSLWCVSLSCLFSTTYMSILMQYFNCLGSCDDFFCQENHKNKTEHLVCTFSIKATYSIYTWVDNFQPRIRLWIGEDRQYGPHCPVCWKTKRCKSESYGEHQHQADHILTLGLLLVYNFIYIY